MATKIAKVNKLSGVSEAVPVDAHRFLPACPCPTGGQLHCFGSHRWQQLAVNAVWAGSPSWVPHIQDCFTFLTHRGGKKWRSGFCSSPGSCSKGVSLGVFPGSKCILPAAHSAPWPAALRSAPGTGSRVLLLSCCRGMCRARAEHSDEKSSFPFPFSLFPSLPPCCCPSYAAFHRAWPPSGCIPLSASHQLRIAAAQSSARGSAGLCGAAVHPGGALQLTAPRIAAHRGFAWWCCAALVPAQSSGWGAALRGVPGSAEVCRCLSAPAWLRQGGGDGWVRTLCCSGRVGEREGERLKI